MFKSYFYDIVEKSDHFLVQLDRRADFSFVKEVCPPRDAQTGRPEWDPLLLFKITLLQFFYNLSDRQVMRELYFHMAYKWFVGLDLHEETPCYSKLSQFRSTLGVEKLAQFHNEVVKQCKNKGLIANRLTIIDSTQVRAKIDHWKKIDEQDNPDKESRFGPPDKRTGKQQRGYKAHLSMDLDSEIITDYQTSPADEHDSNYYEPLLPKEPQLITADKAYDSNEHRIVTKQKGHRYAVIPKGDKKTSSKEKLKRYRVRELKAMKKRKQIEHKIAELKRFHNFKICRYWGKLKFYLQTTFTILVVNLKKMLKLLLLQPNCPYVHKG